MHIDLVPFWPCSEVQHLGYDFMLEPSSALRLIVQLEGSSAATLPDTNQVGQRQFGLWQHHCFELFIGKLESTAYWELNIAPNGNWNCFEFSDYRQQQRASEYCAVTALHTVRTGQSYRLEAGIDINPDLLTSGLALSLGASAVIETPTELNYFSIRHGATPDFHHRDHHMQWVLQ